MTTSPRCGHLVCVALHVAPSLADTVSRLEASCSVSFGTISPCAVFPACRGIECLRVSENGSFIKCNASCAVTLSLRKFLQTPASSWETSKVSLRQLHSEILNQTVVLEDLATAAEAQLVSVSVRLDHEHEIGGHLNKVRQNFF